MGKSLIYIYTQLSRPSKVYFITKFYNNAQDNYYNIQQTCRVQNGKRLFKETKTDLIQVGVPQLRLQVFACGLQESWEVSMQGSWIYLVAVSTGFAYKQCSVYFACMKNGMILTTLLLQLRLTRTTSSQHPHSSLFLQTTSLQHTQTCRYVHGLPIRCRASQ